MNEEEHYKCDRQKDRQKRRKKEGNFFFFLRETCLKTSCFNPFLLLKKEYDDDDVCEQQCEYHWTRRAH